jgi:quercetin dioxygenase-like cupin family protein/DNA-binding XRE family transcriptional regulator
MTAIGQRIRKMREAQQLSRDELCAIAGVSADRLVAIEEGHGIPSVGLVIKLSRVLGSRVDGILHGRGALSRPITVFRAGQPGTAEEEGDTEQGYTYRSLGRPSSPGQGMEPLLITFHPGETGILPIAHDGQEFVYVLEGIVEVVHDGASHTLGPGDSVYLDSNRPHLFRAVGATPARAVGVVWSPD